MLWHAFVVQQPAIAGCLLREGDAPDGAAGAWQGPLPNLRIIARDGAHASRRVTKRPWVADPFLHDVVERTVFAKNSPTRLIQHSEVFSEWFGNHIQMVSRKVTDSKRIRNMQLAKQRFDSTQRPLGRCVLFFEALLLTVVQIAENRKGREEAKHATAWLQWLTVERAVQLSLLADSGDEAMICTRFLDSEEVDYAQLPTECQRFLSRIISLFGPGSRCFTCGYASFMLQTLAEPFIYFINGEPVSLGGKAALTEELKDRQRPNHQQLTTNTASQPSCVLFCSFAWCSFVQFRAPGSRQPPGSGGGDAARI